MATATRISSFGSDYAPVSRYYDDTTTDQIAEDKTEKQLKGYPSVAFEPARPRARAATSGRPDPATDSQTKPRFNQPSRFATGELVRAFRRTVYAVRRNAGSGMGEAVQYTVVPVSLRWALVGGGIREGLGSKRGWREGRGQRDQVRSGIHCTEREAG